MAKSRNFVFTLNNYSDDEVEEVREILRQAKYGVFGFEKGDNGTPHLQGFVAFANPRSFDGTRKLFKLTTGFRIHLEPSKTIHQAIDYCKKDGQWEEFGTIPATQQQKGEMERERWRITLDLAKSGLVDAIDPKVQFLHAKTIEFVHHRELRKRKMDDTPHKMYWLFGPTGTGKSRMAREAFPEAYLKNPNKWWDGYVDQPVVLLEDLDKSHEHMVYYLKIWLDRYPFPAEVKGSSMMIRPRTIVITSNWSPAQIWTEPNDLEPLLRRVTLLDFSNEFHGDLSEIKSLIEAEMDQKQQRNEQLEEEILAGSVGDGFESMTSSQAMETWANEEQVEEEDAFMFSQSSTGTFGESIDGFTF